jgi:chromate transporter
MALILLELALYFGILSLVSFGGIPSVMSEMQRLVVDVKGWATPAEFVQLFAVAQAAPGPNILVVSLFGWKAAGIAGASVALVASCLPAGALAWWVAGLWERFKDSPWRAIITKALAPLVVGLILAGGLVLATPGGTPDWRMWMIAALTAAGTLATKLNPLWLLGGAGVLGAFLLG